MTTTEAVKTIRAQSRKNLPKPNVEKRSTKTVLTSKLARLKTSIPVVVWVTVIRLATILVDYTLVLVTALSVIPMLGAYLHRQSGVARDELTTNGTIALWAAPFLFVVIVLTVAEIAFMCWLWRSGSRRIAKIRRVRSARGRPGPSR